MTDKRHVFYAERDKRTRQYGGENARLEQPVQIIVGDDAAETRAGQVAALALINMVARVHRRVRISVPSTPLVAKGILDASTLDEAATETARAINPVLELDSSSRHRKARHTEVSIGLGAAVPQNLSTYVSWHGGRGNIDSSPRPPSADNGSVLGAAAASVLGATTLFRAVHGQGVTSAAFNPVERTAGLTAGQTTIYGPVDVGSVLTIGAGAVTSALFYWLREIGVVGNWDVVDGDLAELHNTNRCMCLTAEDAGWPDGSPSGVPLHKAAAAARAIGATPYPQWYDEWDGMNVRHDLVLPLANERGIRAAVAQRGEPVLLHATTSPNWTAELHRHLPDRDDCPACRIPHQERPRFTCSDGPAIPDQADSPDAALPFLSAGAGLLLLGALLELPRGDFTVRRFNHWPLDLGLDGPAFRMHRHPPRDGCQHELPRRLRRIIQSSQRRRWDYLDADVEAGTEF